MKATFSTTLQNDGCKYLRNAHTPDLLTGETPGFNECYEQSRRFVKFDIRGLFDTAVRAVGNDATKCIRATKLREGQSNKAFLLVMDNGAEVVAKIPNPNAGPAHYTTASEVATMNWVRDVLKIPVPAVLGWSSDTANPVKSEYIIMEKAGGTLLSDIWYQLERDAKNQIIQQVVDLQVCLSSCPATAHGCLFYRKDLPSNLQYIPETFGNSRLSFTIGPVVSPTLWSDGRGELDVGKGPWLNLSTYATDLGRNEQEWIIRNAKPRMNFFRDSDTPEQPAEMLSLLEKYLAVAPHIRAGTGRLTNFGGSILSHPDLNLSNIFVDPATNKLTSIIDWQGATFAPLIMQARLPRMIKHPELLQPGLVFPERPDGYDDLDVDARKAANVLHESALCQKYYEVLLAKQYPQLYSAITLRMSLDVPLLEPTWLVCGSWKDREIYKLRASLMRIASGWNSLGIGLASCPITFSEKEISLHEKEIDNIDHVESIMAAFQEEGILPADGRVDPQDYEVLQEVNQCQKKRYLSLATTAEEAMAMEETWPWQDWPERQEHCL